MKVSWPIEGISITSTKIYQYFSVFILFPSFRFQPAILFSLHPDGGLRRSRWPCRPRTTLRRALPDGATLRGAIQGDRREFAHYPEAGGQTTTHRGRTANPCSSTVRPPARPVWPPAPGIEALGPIFGTHRRICVTTVKLSTSRMLNTSSILGLSVHDSSVSPTGCRINMPYGIWLTLVLTFELSARRI
jgi:hypothetical protein